MKRKIDVYLLYFSYVIELIYLFSARIFSVPQVLYMVKGQILMLIYMFAINIPNVIHTSLLIKIMGYQWEL